MWKFLIDRYSFLKLKTQETYIYTHSLFIILNRNGFWDYFCGLLLLRFNSTTTLVLYISRTPFFSPSLFALVLFISCLVYSWIRIFREDVFFEWKMSLEFCQYLMFEGENVWIYGGSDEIDFRSVFVLRVRFKAKF